MKNLKKKKKKELRLTTNKFFEKLFTLVTTGLQFEKFCSLFLLRRNLKGIFPNFLQSLKKCYTLGKSGSFWSISFSVRTFKHILDVPRQNLMVNILILFGVWFLVCDFRHDSI